MGVKKVAIACQGGGTHAAFTWGVLTRILETKRQWDAGAGEGDTFDIVAISGTSAGALCALAAWYGLVPNTADPDCGTLEKAIERLDFLWTTFAAQTPAEASHNMVVGALLDLKERGVPLPGLNPYDIYDDIALTGLAMLGARRQYLEFPGLLAAICPHFDAVDWPAVARLGRRMLAGAIEIVSGNFEIFDSDSTLRQKGLLAGAADEGPPPHRRWRMHRPLSLDGVAASGTLPELLQAQRIPGMTFPTRDPAVDVTRDGLYWDGLYSQNPPVRPLVEGVTLDAKPDEIWVVRINPQEGDAEAEVGDLEEIRDRENELAGNLSLNQELDHILTVNHLLARYGRTDPPFSRWKHIEVRTIKMRLSTASGLRRTSKFDRSPRHLRRLRSEGRSVAEAWLNGWRTEGDDFDRYPDDARYREAD